MDNTEEILKGADLQEVATKGAEIYESVKGEYDPIHKGKFLAIEIESKMVYLADTSADAVVAARAAHPNKVFYVMKIGFDAAETLAHFSSTHSNDPR